nr:retrovirus-related Pol polyprotein from transposon TNT 1-94 [Tanacetum cinerariifolium]
MHSVKSQSEHIDEFHKLVGDLAAIDTTISDADNALLLLTSLPSSYDNFMATLLYVWDTLKLEDVLMTLNSRELQKMIDAKGDGGTCKVQVQMSDGTSFVLDNVKYVLELRRNLISLGTLEKEGFTMKMQSGKIKVIRGSLVVLSGTRRANYVYTLDVQAMTRKTLKGRKQLGVYPTRWKIKIEDTIMSTYLVNWSASSAIGFKTPIDMLGFLGWLASINQQMLELVKVKCIFLRYRKGIV